MAEFTVSPLASPTSYFSGFPSPATHIATLPEVGDFYMVSTAIHDPAQGCPCDFSVIWDDGSGTLRTLWSATLNTNMACLDAFASGVLIAAWADYQAGIFYTATWQDPRVSGTPVIKSITGPAATGIIKGAMVCDRGRGLAYYGGANGYFHRITDDGTVAGSQQVFQHGGAASAPATSGYGVHYLDLEMDERNLYAAICTAIVVPNGNPSYYNVSMAMCPDPSDIGGTSYWTSKPYSKFDWLALPFDPSSSGLGAWLTLGEQGRHGNNLLLGTAVNDGMVYALLMQGTAEGERLYADDRFYHLTNELLCLPWWDQPMYQSVLARIRSPLEHGGVLARGASGRPIVRDDGIYVVTHNRRSLVAYRRQHGADEGDFRLYAETPIPDLGTGIPHYVGVLRGQRSDPSIKGMFSILNCTGPEWVAGAHPTASVFRFSLPCG
jgi:hypothetical protein